MDLVRNRKTMLWEGYHDTFKVPYVQQKSIGTIRLDGQVRGVHTVPLSNRLTLDFFIQASRSDELVVTFHGANRPDKNFYPRFERVASLRKAAPALVAFADPTMQLSTDQSMLLSWYLGGPGWDPLNDVLKVINKALGKAGASRVIFVGGSGGGYAALRASAMVPGSMAFVQAPQTVLANYIPRVVQHYFDTVWPGWDPKLLLSAFPERFDMVRYYQQRSPDNHVYFMVSSSDESHVRDHYAPFKSIYGVMGDSGSDRSGKKLFVQYDGAVPGHGTVTAEEFDYHFSKALTHYRSSHDGYSSGR